MLRQISSLNAEVVHFIECFCFVFFSFQIQHWFVLEKEQRRWYVSSPISHLRQQVFLHCFFLG